MRAIALGICIFLCNLFAVNAAYCDTTIGLKTVEINADDTVKLYSIAEHAIILEDPEGELKVSDVRRLDANSFSDIKTPVPNLDFTTSSYWVKFEIRNNTSNLKEFLLEVARPLTNKADLYTLHPNGLILTKQHGDDLPFFNREINHRRIVFPIKIEPKREYTYYLNISSDGEVVMLPMKLWKPTAFSEQNYREQYILGFYYGILLFVIIIYFFFFVALKERSFLYYVLYVISLFIFQLCLDGLAYQFLWPDWVWFGNHATLITANTTVFALVKYAQVFLDLRNTMPKWNKVFNVLLAIIVVCFICAFTGGKLYAIDFIATNAISFVSILIIIAAILAYKKKHKVNLFFLLAFLCIIAGGVIFILGNFGVLKYSLFTEQAIKFGSAVEVIFLSLTMAGKYRDIQKEKENAQDAVLNKMQEMNKLKDEINEQLELQVKERTAEINNQNVLLAEKNKDITDSINYAKRIQDAIIPTSVEFERLLPNSFVLFKPKDIVSGDFYWIAEKNNKVLFTASDCTGHGVPGAFMSVIGSSLYNQVVNEQGETQPAEILNQVRLGIIKALKQKGESGSQRDGMDVAFCTWDKTTESLQYAGANNSLYIIREDSKGNIISNEENIKPVLQINGFSLFEINADRQPVGVYTGDKAPFTNNNISLQKGDTVYMYTDGYPDQFGGENGKKFKTANFKKLLISLHQKPMNEQKEVLDETIEKWMKGHEQVDDICVIGSVLK